MTFTTRAGKGTALTHQELDDNFATLGAVHGANDVVLTVPMAANEGLTVTSYNFTTTPLFVREFGIGDDPFATAQIIKGDFADSISTMMGTAGYLGQGVQFRVQTASHPLDVDNGGSITQASETNIGAWNASIQNYTDDDNFFSTLAVATLNRENKVETISAVALFNKNALTAKKPFIAEQGITSNGDNTIGDGSGDVTLNGPLFILGGNPSAPTATSDPGTPGELRVTTPDFVNFYMYLYADGVGWLRTQFTTF